MIQPFEREQHIFIIFAFELLHELAEGDFFARFGGVEAGVQRRFQLLRVLPGGFGGRLGENLLSRIEEAQLFAFQKSLIPRGQFGGRLNRQAVIAPAVHLRRQMQADIHRGLTGGRRAERQRRFADGADDVIRRFLREKAAQTLVGGHFQQDRNRREAHEPFLRGLAVDPEPKRVLALSVERRRDDFFHLLGGLLHVLDLVGSVERGRHAPVGIIHADERDAERRKQRARDERERNPRIGADFGQTGQAVRIGDVAQAIPVVDVQRGKEADRPFSVQALDQVAALLLADPTQQRQRHGVQLLALGSDHI